MSFQLVSSAATLLGIPLSSRYNCCRQPQLPVGATHIAWSGCCCYCWCRGGCLSDCCISSWPCGHPLPLSTTTYPFPSLCSYFYLLQSHNRKEDAWTLFGGVWTGELHLNWGSLTYLPPHSTLASLGKQYQLSLWDVSSLFSSLNSVVLTMDEVLWLYHIVFFIANMLHCG